MKQLSYRNVLAVAALTPAIVIPMGDVALADEVAVPNTDADVILVEDIVGSEVKTLPKYYSSDLGTFSDINSLAEEIIEAAKNGDSTVAFKYTGDLSKISTDLKNALNAALVLPGNDYIHGTLSSWKYSYTPAGDFSLTLTFLATAAQEAYVTEQVQAIAASLNKAGMTDFDKVKAVNDYVVTHTVYSRTATTTPHHVYAYLKEGKAVCQAYALLTYRLLTEMGVEARYVVGYAGEAHAWNSVKIDGQWYHLDTTWNDSSFNGYDSLSNIGYRYFLVTTETLRKDHSWEEASYPVATDTRYSHYHDIGYGIESDGEIYYRHSDDGTLYKLNIATGNKEQLLKTGVAYLEAHNEFVYFADFSNGGYLTSYNLITGEKTVLESKSVTRLQIVNGILNYKVGNTSKQYELPLSATEKAVRDVDLAIAKLSEFSPLTDLEAARSAYAALTAEQQAKIVNLSKLTTLETKYPVNLAAADAVATNINKYTATSSRANLLAVIAEFDALTAAQQSLVSNKNSVLDFKAVIAAQDTEIAAIEKMISSLKASSTKLLTEIDAARAAYDALSAELQQEVSNVATLVKFENDTTLAETAFNLISKLDGTSIDAIIAARDAYNAVPSAYRKQVTNLKQLTTFEASVKNVTAAVKAINAIDPTSTKFVAQVKAARKAYNKAGTQQSLVTNGAEFLDVEKQALVFEQISKLKASSAKYIAEVTAAKTAYDALSTNTLVSNVAILNTAINAIKPAQAVIAEIDALDDSSVQAILTARANFTALPKAEQKYVTNLKDLTALEKAVKNPLAAIKAIDAIDPDSKQFVTQVKAARKALDKAGDQADLVTNAEEFESIEAQALVFEKISKLKASSPKYIAEVTAAKEDYDALSTKTYVTNAAILTAAVDAIKPAQAVIAEIAALDESSVEPIITARANFTKLAKAEQKYVTNLKALTALEKAVKNPLAAIKAIDAIDPTSKQFVAQVKAARKALDKAGDQADLVTNAEEFESIEAQALVFEQISKLKPSSAKYIAEVTAAKEAFDDLGATNSLVTNKAILDTAVETIEAAQNVIDAIDALDGSSADAVVATRTSFNLLPKAEQKYVTNLKVLTNHEKSLKNVITAINAINAIDSTSKQFVAQVKTARTALNKAGDQADLVTNADEFASIEAQALVFDQISKLKATSAKYIEEVTAAQEAFENLGTTNSLVTNVNILNTAINAIKPAQAVITTIESLDGSSVAAIAAARTAFNELPKAEQKYVTNLKTLTAFEKAVLPVTKAMQLIDETTALDPASTAFFSKAAAMKKAYVALSDENKELVTNTADYEYALALYEIKNAQKTRKWTAVTTEMFETLSITGVTDTNFDVVAEGFNALKAGVGTATVAEIQQNVTNFLNQ